MATKEVSIGINAKVKADTSELEALKSRAADGAASLKSMGAAGEDALERMSGALEKMGTVLERNLEKMERLMQTAAQGGRTAPLEGASINNYARAERGIDLLGPAIGKANRGADIDKLEQRLSTAQRFAAQAERKGEDVTKLTDRLKELRAELDAQKQRVADLTAARGAGGPPSGGSGGGGSGGLNNYGRAERGLNALGPSISGARLPSDTAGLQARIETARKYTEQAAGQGKDVTKLTEKLEELTKALEEQKKKIEDNTRAQGGSPGGSGGGAGGPTPPPTPDADGTPAPTGLQAILDNAIKKKTGAGLDMLKSAGVPMELLGSLARIAGPLAIGGALIGGFNAATNGLTNLNADARNTVDANADFARQIGYRGNANALFRNPYGQFAGATDPDIAKYGYSASDAMRVASRYDMPGGMKGDIKGILGFSRTTGVDADRTAGIAQLLNQGGAFKTGDSANALGGLKIAMAEGVKMGIGQSETLRAISSVVQANYARGIITNPLALAFSASQTSTLAGTGSRVLQGAAGQDAAGKLNAGITGGGDQGLEMLQLNALGSDYTAKDLGLEGKAAEQFERIRKQSPVQAGRMALELIKANRGKGLSTKLATSLEKTLGGRGSLMNDMFLQSIGLGVDQRLEIGAMGIGEYYKKAAGGTDKYVNRAGQIDTDVQGGNNTAKVNRAMQVRDNDLAYITKIKDLALSGGLEVIFRDISAGVQGLMNSLKPGANQFGGGDYGGSVQPYLYQAAAGKTAPPAATAAALLNPSPYVNLATPSSGGYAFMGGGQGMATTSTPGVGGHKGYDFVFGDSKDNKPDVVINPFPMAKVIFAGDGQKVKAYVGYGNCVHLRLQGGRSVIFGHFKVVYVRTGQTVNRGDRLGVQGSTGNSTGPHVHFEMKDANGVSLGSKREVDGAYAEEVAKTPAVDMKANYAANPEGANTDAKFAATTRGAEILKKYGQEMGIASMSDPIDPTKLPMSNQEFMGNFIRSRSGKGQEGWEKFLKEMAQWQATQGQQRQSVVVTAQIPKNLGVGVTTISPAAAAAIARAVQQKPQVVIKPGTVLPPTPAGMGGNTTPPPLPNGTP